jgi:arsenate reductase
MNKAYYLGTCDTCGKILEETGINKKARTGTFHLQDIKTDKMTPEQVDELKSKAGSYEALFSRRSLKYKEWGLKDKTLGEADYRNYLLQEYTFLKRPVVLVGNKIFIGNDQKTVAALKESLR